MSISIVFLPCDVEMTINVICIQFLGSDLIYFFSLGGVPLSANAGWICISVSSEIKVGP